MQVARLEVRLGARERRRDSPQVGERAHVRGSIEQLADARAPADPVSRREGVEEALAEQVRPNRAADLDLGAPRVIPFELVLEVLDEVRERDAEQILHEVARELQAFVRVVVLVVLAALSELEFEDRASDAPEENRLLRAVLPRIAEVRQQAAVQDRLDLLDPVLLRLTRRELAFVLVQRVLFREDPVRRVPLLVADLLA